MNDQTPTWESTVPVGSGDAPTWESTQPVKGGDYWSDVGHSAVEGLKEWPGAAESMGKQVVKMAPGMMPGAIPTTVTEMFRGKPFRETPVGQTVEGVTDIARGVPDAVLNTAKDMGRTVTDFPRMFRERPLSTVANVAAIAGGATGLARRAIPMVAEGAEAVSTDAARRSLGFTKRFLNKPGNLAKANEASRAMLDEGVIQNPITHPFSSGTESMLGRTEDLMDVSGNKMGMTRQMLDTHGIPGPHATESAEKVVQELNPRFSDERRIADEIAEDMKALGDERLSYDDAFTVLKKLDQKAKFSPMGGPTDQLKANMYRKAYGIFRKELDQAVERGAVTLGDFDGKISAEYGKSKKLFGHASNATKALTNKVSSEAGNNRIGLREAAVGAAELAAGNPGKAAASIGAIEGVKRFGNAGLATTAKAVSKAFRSAPSLSGEIPQTIERVGTGAVAGKVLTEEKAREFLKQAKGNKDLARQLALQAGWTF